MFEFEKLSVMVSDVSMSRLVLLFTEGLTEPLRGLVKAHKPTTLKDAMNLTRDLKNLFPRTKYPPNPNFPYKFKEGKKPWKNDFFAKENKGGPIKEELWKKKLCFTCQQPWVPRHRCAKEKAHYIEFFSEEEEKEK